MAKKYLPYATGKSRIQIIEKPTLDQFNRRIRQINSAPARGVLYAQAGLLDEAEQELSTHLHLQPADETARKLLRTIKSWREP
jgi:hypothetical protein